MLALLSDLKISKFHFVLFSLDFSWLKKWKDRADSDDQRQMEERKQEENSSGMSCHLSHFTSALTSQLRVRMWFLMSCDRTSITALLTPGFYFNDTGFSMCGILGWKSNNDNDDVLRADSWDCGDFQGEAGPQDDREEPLCNTVLLTGPPGVGKTAAVYACSQELGFKVGPKSLNASMFLIQTKTHGCTLSVILCFIQT